MPAKKHKKHAVESLARDWNCRLEKNSKEWAFYDNLDGVWVSGCALVSGREVKDSYVRLFLKKIQEKRAKQQSIIAEQING